MNEPGASTTVERSAERADVAPSFGPRLAEARKAMSLSVGDIAARLRISTKQVMAIEQEDLGALPQPAYLRGFLRNYAKEVRIDPAPLIEALNRKTEPMPNAPAARGPSPLVRSAERERLSRTLVIAGAVGALIVFAVVGWIATQRAPRKPPQAKVETPAAVAAAPLPATGDAAPSAFATPAATPANAALSTSASVAPEAPAAPVEAGTLKFSFRDRSWVEVVQKDGTVLMSQNNAAGSEQTVRGKPPYRIVIGNASAVTLEYDGKAIDLKPAASGGDVARLTLP